MKRKFKSIQVQNEHLISFTNEVFIPLDRTVRSVNVEYGKESITTFTQDFEPNKERHGYPIQIILDDGTTVGADFELFECDYRDYDGHAVGIRVYDMDNGYNTLYSSGFQWSEVEDLAMFWANKVEEGVNKHERH